MDLNTFVVLSPPDFWRGKKTLLAEINLRGSLQGKQQTSAAVVGSDCNIACICGILSHFKELFLTPTE